MKKLLIAALVLGCAAPVKVKRPLKKIVEHVVETSKPPSLKLPEPKPPEPSPSPLPALKCLSTNEVMQEVMKIGVNPKDWTQPKIEKRLDIKNNRVLVRVETIKAKPDNGIYKIEVYAALDLTTSKHATIKVVLTGALKTVTFVNRSKLVDGKTVYEDCYDRTQN